MFEGIEILNGGQVVNLKDLQKGVDGEFILEGISTLKINLQNGASYNENVEILENNSDVKLSLLDANGDEVVIILRGLGELLLTNNSDVPVFEVFQVDGEKLASFITIDDLEAAAAGGETISSEQTGNPTGAGALDGTDSGDIADRLPGLGDPGLADPETPTFGFSVEFGGDNVLEITEDVGQSEDGILSGTITAVDPFYGVQEFIPQTVTTEYGIFTIDSVGNWTYDLFEDNSDIQGLSDDESLLDTITLDLVGLVGSYDFPITINGLNDKPEVDNIYINRPIIDEPIPDELGDNIQEDQVIRVRPFENTIYETEDKNGDDGHDDEGNNTFTGTIAIRDADINNTHTLFIDSVDVIDNSLSGITYPEDITVSLTPNESGEWQYNISGDFTKLSSGEKLTLNVYYYADDNSRDDLDNPYENDPLNDDTTNEDSRSDIKFIQVTITGTNDQPVVDEIILGEEDKIYESDLQDGRHFYGNEQFKELPREYEDSTFMGQLSEARDEDTNNTNPHYKIVGKVEVSSNAIGMTANDVHVDLLGANNNGWSTSRDYKVFSEEFNNLADGETVTITFYYKASDWEGFGKFGDAFNEPSHSDVKKVQITITGTNDQPVIDDVIVGVEEKIYEDTLKDKRGFEDSMYKGKLSEVRDEDTNNTNPHYKIVGAVEVSQNAIGITAADLDVFLPGANNNGWSTSRDYKVFSEEFNKLADGESVTITFYYKASDWEGFRTTGDAHNEPSHSEVKKVELTITGTNDQPVVDEIILGVETKIYESDLQDGRAEPGENQFRGLPRVYEESTFMGQLSEARDEDTNNTDPHYKILGGVKVSQNAIGMTSSDVDVDLLGANNNGWSTSRDYKVFSEKFNSLGVDETVTIQFRYKASDWEGFRTTGDAHNEPSHSEVQLVSITITGTNDQPVVDTVERRIAEEENGANRVTGQLTARDDDVTNQNEITYELIDFDNNTPPSNSEVVYSVGGNTFKLLSDDVNVNKFTSKITNVSVSSTGEYVVEGDFTKLAKDEEITLIFQYQADDNEGISSGNPIHEQSLSNIETVELTIVGTNDKPVLKNVVNTIDFTENDSPIVIDDTLKVKDVDDSHLEGATVTISSNYQSGADFLAIDAGDLADGVNANFVGGVLTLSGTATKDEYEEMLEHVTFVNTSEDPTDSPRTITWVLDDGDNTSNPKTTIINVIPVNDAPVAFKNFNEVVEAGVGVSAAANLSGNVITEEDKQGNKDYDVDNPEDLVISAVKSNNRSSDFDADFDKTLNGQPAIKIKGEYGILFVNANGDYEYNLKDGWDSTDSLKDGEIVRDKFTYKLSDGDKFDTAKLVIKITGTNDAPEAENDTYTNAENDALITLEDTPLVIAPTVLLANDEDAEGDNLEIIDVELVNPLSGSVEINDDGDIVFIPEPNFSGDATFEYTVSDGNGGVDTATVTVNVVADADAPILGIDISETYHPEVPPTSVISFDTTGVGQNVFAYKKKGDAFTNDDLEVNSLQDTKATVSSNPGNGLGVNANNDTGSLPAVIDGNELMVFDLGGLYSSANIVFKHAKGDELRIRAYDENGNKVGSTVISGLFANDAANTVLFNPSGSDTFSYITVHGIKINNKGKEGFNVKEIEVINPNPHPEYYEYNIDVHAVLTDSNETLSDVTISGIPGGTQIVSLDNNGETSIQVTSPTALNHDDIKASVTSTEPSNSDTATTEAIHNMLSLSADDANLDLNNVNDLDLPKVEEIYLTSGNHILSNISVNDVLIMTDDKILEVKGDNGDKIDLDLGDPLDFNTVNQENNKWYANSSLNTTDEDAYVSTDGTDVVTLLIDKDVEVI